MGDVPTHGDASTEQGRVRERTDPRRAGILVALIVVTIAIIVLFRREDAGFFTKYGDIGTMDFVQYWGAYKLLVSGQNPYDPALMDALEIAPGVIISHEHTWNPPWLITLIQPVLALPFFVSVGVWLATNVVLMGLTGFLTWKTYAPKARPEAAVILATFLFLPHVATLLWGQIALLHAAAVALLLFGIKREDWAMAGLALVPLTTKPHLFYLALVLLAYWILVERRWQVVAWFCVGFALLVGATLLQFPGAIQQWMASFDQPPMHWVVGSVVGVIRYVVHGLTGEIVGWPAVVVPGISLVGMVGWLVVRRPAPELVWRLPAVLAVSLFTSPYGWFFDQSQLVVVQVALVALVSRPLVPPNVRRPVYGVLGATQVGIATQNLLGIEEHHFYFWVSLALGFVWIWGLRHAGIADPLRTRRCALG